jgi:hypothetical protein
VRATLLGMSGDPPVPSWRFLIKPRWLGWHALMVASVLGMLALGNWQLQRAEAGNALSWAYTFEWPIFAVFAIVFWAKTIRDEFHPPAPSGTPAEDLELPGGRPGQPARPRWQWLDRSPGLSRRTRNWPTTTPTWPG